MSLIPTQNSSIYSQQIYPMSYMNQYNTLAPTNMVQGTQSATGTSGSEGAEGHHKHHKHHKHHNSTTGTSASPTNGTTGAQPTGSPASVPAAAPTGSPLGSTASPSGIESSMPSLSAPTNPTQQLEQLLSMIGTDLAKTGQSPSVLQNAITNAVQQDSQTGQPVSPKTVLSQVVSSLGINDPNLTQAIQNSGLT